MIFLVPRWDEFPGGLVSPPWSDLLEANAKLRGVQMSNSLVAPGGSVGCFQYPKNVRTCTMVSDGTIHWINWCGWTFSKKQMWRSTRNAPERKVLCSATTMWLLWPEENLSQKVGRSQNASKYTWKSEIKRPVLELGNQTLANPSNFFQKEFKNNMFSSFSHFSSMQRPLTAHSKPRIRLPATKDPFMGRAFAWLGAGAMVVSGSANHHISTWVFSWNLGWGFPNLNYLFKETSGVQEQ